MRRLMLILAFMTMTVLGAAGAAQAVVVDMSSLGHSSVVYNASDRGGYVGVSMLPGTESTLGSNNIPTVTSGDPCQDPELPSDLVLPDTGLCWHGGPVIHRNESFALTWDQHRAFWQTTRNYVEQFLGDVATGSGTLGSPYSITGQYADSSGKALNSSLFGGGCIDFGSVGGAACKFGSTSGDGPGNDFPASNCTPTGSSYSFGTTANTTCLTDGQIQAEIRRMVLQTGMLGRTAKGYTPVVDVFLPIGVEACLDGSGTLCSANSDPAQVPARFCSYHSHLNVSGTDLPYVVQPWTPYTACDELEVPDLGSDPTVQEVAIDAGRRLVSPLARSQLGAFVNPNLGAWFALDGSEIGDHGCLPGPKNSSADKVTVGTSSQNPYWIQREFDNAGVIQSDLNSPLCAPSTILTPAFVLPSSVNPGDVVDFDGSGTASTLIVPKAGYQWSFGDGSTSVGPSVTHAYTTPGTYSVKLTVTDRGGNTLSLAQTLVVLGSTGGHNPPPRWHPTMQLMPQSLRSVLRHGVAVRVSTTKQADGIAMLLVPRRSAKRAHLKLGRSGPVVVGRGTIAGIRTGTSMLHLHVSRTMAKEMRQARHLLLTVRLELFAGRGEHLMLDAAGRY